MVLVVVIDVFICELIDLICNVNSVRLNGNTAVRYEWVCEVRWDEMRWGWRFDGTHTSVMIRCSGSSLCRPGPELPTCNYIHGPGLPIIRHWSLLGAGGHRKPFFKQSPFTLWTQNTESLWNPTKKQMKENLFSCEETNDEKIFKVKFSLHLSFHQINFPNKIVKKLWSLYEWTLLNNWTTEAERTTKHQTRCQVAWQLHYVHSTIQFNMYIGGFFFVISLTIYFNDLSLVNVQRQTSTWVVSPSSNNNTTKWYV